MILVLFEGHCYTSVVLTGLMEGACVPSAVTRTVRVISQLRGNMLLVGVGGSGRQSLSKMAAFICEYKVYQVEITKHYRKQEFREGGIKVPVSLSAPGIPMAGQPQPTLLSCLQTSSSCIG